MAADAVLRRTRKLVARAAPLLVVSAWHGLGVWVCEFVVSASAPPKQPEKSARLKKEYKACAAEPICMGGQFFKCQGCNKNLKAPVCGLTRKGVSELPEPVGYVSTIRLHANSPCCPFHVLSLPFVWAALSPALLPLFAGSPSSGGCRGEGDDGTLKAACPHPHSPPA